MFNLFKFMQPSGVRKGSVTAHTIKMIQSDMRNVDTLLQSKQPSQMRQALITTDKALDNALKDSVHGETMGERLKNAADLFDRDLYNKIWSAHKMRNALVHESGYEPPHHMITQGIDTLKKALNSLGVR